MNNDRNFLSEAEVVKLIKENYTLKRQIVTNLPDPGLANFDPHTIYLVENAEAGGYSEYIYIERQFLSDLLNQNGCTEEKIKKIQNVTKEDISHCANLLSQISLAVVKEDESCTI